MKKAAHILKWIAGIGVFAFLVAFENIQQSRMVVKDMPITIKQHANQLFLNEQDVRKVIDNQYDSIILKEINAINTTLLEESLENHPFIADAEVFSTLDGLLSINVEQKEAMARVVSSKKHFYLDAQGQSFPISKSYSAQVPVFTGRIDSASVTSAFQLLNTIKSMPYFANYTAEIHTLQNGEIELIPANGRHRVMFGETKNAQDKLKKLKGFYQTVVTEENLNDWKTLNIAYANQLVSTKY